MSINFCGTNTELRPLLSWVFFIRPIGPLPLLMPLISFSKNKWANQAGGISSTFSNKELNAPILRGLESEDNQVSICYLLLFTRHLLCPGTVPAIRSLIKMSNFFHVAPTGQRLRWKLQRTKKSQRFAKIEPYPQEVVSSLSSEVFKPRLFKPLVGWL